MLKGTLRDFTDAHPDFEPGIGTGLITGAVENTLDADGKPVLAEGSASDAALITNQSTFSQWFRDVPGVNKSVDYPISLELKAGEPGVYTYAREKQSTGAHQYFFPLDGMGSDVTWADMQTTGTGYHNYYFTYELETLFTYTPRYWREDPSQDLVFKFVGDDDVWVFINNQLVVDLGGIHGQVAGSVNLDDEADRLGLVPGRAYELKLFFAERHVTQSNFRIETTLQISTESAPLYD
ncbi:MAG: fibro-slime domain-containing protein [Planctomycetota bacterium]